MTAPAPKPRVRCFCRKAKTTITVRGDPAFVMESGAGKNKEKVKEHFWLPPQEAVPLLSWDNAAVRGDGRTGAKWGDMDLEALLLDPTERALKPTAGKRVARSFYHAYTERDIVWWCL